MMACVGSTWAFLVCRLGETASNVVQREKGADDSAMERSRGGTTSKSPCRRGCRRTTYSPQPVAGQVYDRAEALSLPGDLEEDTILRTDPA